MDTWWEPALRDTFEGRRVIIGGSVATAWTAYLHDLRDAGATDVMIVATEGAGVGEQPDVPIVVAEPPEDLAMMERIRWGNEILRQPTPDIVAAVDEFDPDGSAIVVGSFLNEAPDLAGRPFLSYRRPEWVALEDKTVVDELWDRAGVPRLPAAVATLDDADAAAATIDRGDGTVWAADASDGYHGGAHLTRWVTDETTRDAALETFRPVSERVRVMPFVDGIPCSVHGIVFADGVAALRPVEMVTLRRGNDLVYGGCATYWDPPDEVRDDMRAVARRVGATLADEVDYRGTFTVDGVVGADGFWPTELNPRFGAGLSVIARAAGNIPILLVHDHAVAGRPLGLPAAEIERRLLDHADAHRAGGTWRAVSPTTTERTGPAAFDGEAWSWLDDDGDDGDDGADRGVVDGRITAGPGFARCAFEPARTPVGPSAAPRAAAFWRFADAELGTELGEVVPAPDRTR